MKIMVVHPGASYSTGDMYDGYMKILQQRHEIIEYRLDGRVTMADNYLAFAWRQATSRRRARMLKADPSTPPEQAIPKPQMAEAVRMASMTLLEAALSTLPDWVLIFSGMFLHPDAVICLYRAGVP